MSLPNELIATGPPLPRRKHWSLRAELLASHLLLVALVVVGFGGSIYVLVRQATYRQAESDLLGAAQLLAHDLEKNQSQTPLAVSQAYRHRFGPAPRDSAYFVIWDSQGRKIGGREPLPPHVQRPEVLPPSSGPRPFLSQTHGTHLEVVVRGPASSLVLIGRPLAKEFDRLQRLAALICLFGLISLGAAACGAWWLARRVVSPLERLTATAELITAKNLDQHLEPPETPSELNRLASVFNTMLNRLQDAFQRQLRFTADASHELRTPVAIILSQSEQTLSKARTPEEYQAAMDTCLRAARRMKRLVDDLLLLARSDAGRMELKQESLDLADVSRQAVAWLEPLAREQQVRLTSQLQTTLMTGDGARLGQIVANLVANAVQYNRPGGEVFVTVHTRGTTAELIVADTGIGIPPGDQPHLFERFYRADRARTHSEGQGTGLGLSIVSEIVAAQGGTIHVTSEVGVGTTVTVRLPLSSRPVSHS